MVKTVRKKVPLPTTDVYIYCGRRDCGGGNMKRTAESWKSSGNYFYLHGACFNRCIR